MILGLVQMPKGHCQGIGLLIYSLFLPALSHLWNARALRCMIDDFGSCRNAKRSLPGHWVAHLLFAFAWSLSHSVNVLQLRKTICGVF